MCITVALLNLDLLDPDDPFEVNGFPTCSNTKYLDWRTCMTFGGTTPCSTRLLPAPADWLMVGEVPGGLLVVPLMKPNSGDETKVRPIGVYRAPAWLDSQYRDDRR